MGFFKSESYSRGIIVSTLFNFGAKGLGFVNSLLIVFFFGSNFGTDLYFLILATVILLTSFINSLDLLVIIPQAMRIRTEEGAKAEFSFLNFFLFAYVIIGLSFSVLIGGAPVFFYSLFSKYTLVQLETLRLMLLLSALLFPLQLLNSFFISILTSHKYFTVPMVVSLVNSIISITLLVLLKNRMSITSAIIAQIVGFGFNFFWLTFYLVKQMNWNFFSGISRPSFALVKNIGLMQLNLVPVSLRAYITTFILSGLGAGVITALNYGQQISYIPELLITTQIIAVTGIKLNELSAQNEKQELNRFFVSLLNVLLLVMLPIGAIIAINASEIVRLLFLYAKKLDSAMLDQLSLCIFFLSLTLPARALDLMMTRLITAQQKIKDGVIYAIVMHALFTALVFTGTTIYGLQGFLIANLVGYVVLLPILYYFLTKKSVPFIHFGKWLTTAVPFVLINAVLIVSLYFAKRQLLLFAHPAVSITITTVIYIGCIFLYNQRVGYVPMNSSIKKLVLRK